MNDSSSRVARDAAPSDATVSARTAGKGFRLVFRTRRVLVADFLCPHLDDAETGLEVSPRHSVVIPRRGAFVRHLGRKRIFADANHVLYFNRGEESRVSHPADEPDRCTVLVLEEELVGEMVSGAGGALSADRFARSSAPLSSDLYSLHRLLLRALREPWRDDLESEAALALLLHRVTSEEEPRVRHSPARGRTLAAHDRLVEEVQAILSRELTANLSLDELARRTHSSPYHLVRVFAARTGVPIHRYRMRLRLRQALEEVIDGPRELTAVALSMGFASHSHFTDAFRREFGATPSAIRRAPSAAQVQRLRRAVATWVPSS